MRTRRRLEDEEDDDVVRDGEVVRVGILVRDGHTTAIDYCSDDPLAMHRPGFRRATDSAARDAAERAYRAMVEEASNAWRSPQRVAADSERNAAIARDEVSILDAEARRFA